MFTADDNNTIELFNPAPTAISGARSRSSPACADSPVMPPTSAGDLYPHMFAMPSGRTMVAGPSRADSWFLNTPVGTARRSRGPDLPDTTRQRTYGNSVLLPPPPGVTAPSTKVVQIGGFPRATEPGTPWIRRSSSTRPRHPPRGSPTRRAGPRPSEPEHRAAAGRLHGCGRRRHRADPNLTGRRLRTSRSSSGTPRRRRQVAARRRPGGAARLPLGGRPAARRTGGLGRRRRQPQSISGATRHR